MFGSFLLGFRRVVVMDRPRPFACDHYGRTGFTVLRTVR
jgi:hypothetical protein